MRILVVHTRHRDHGGEDVVVDAEVELLRSAGHVVALHQEANPHGRAAAATFAAAPWNRAAAHRLGTAIRAFGPEVVHVHNTWFALSPAIFATAAASGAAVVTTLHNYRMLCADGTLFRDGSVCTECVGTAGAPALSHACYRGSRAATAVAVATINSARATKSHEHVDQFIAPSELVRRTHVEAGALDPALVAVKPHFLTDPGPPVEWLDRAEEYVFAGRLAPGKGVETLLEAWRSVTVADRKLVVVGDGPLRHQLEAAAPPGVEFLGHQPLAVTRDRVAHARALLFSSEWLEPFGLVLIEALARATPVLGFATGDTADIVGRGGVLVPTGERRELARVIDRLGDVELEAIGRAGRDDFCERFTPQPNLERLLELYRHAIERRAARP